MSPPKRAPAGRRLPTQWLFLPGMLTVLVAFGVPYFKSAIHHAAKVQTTARPTSRSDETAIYASCGGSASCRECHAEEYSEWEHSHHGLAERNPVAAWDDAAFIPTRSFTIGAQTTMNLDRDAADQLQRTEYYRWVYDNRPVWQKF